MRWRVKPIRKALNSWLDPEALIRPFAPAGRLQPALAGLASLSPPNQEFSSIWALAARPGSNRPGPLPEPDPEADHDSNPDSDPENDENGVNTLKSGPETDELPQPSDEDSVPDDMATLVLDNPALGSSTASRPGSQPYTGINYAQDETSDAAIMLRVAAGDEAGFNYLAGKYHRPMINFLFRMVRNQAVAEELAQEVFLRVYRSRESYRAEAKFTTWLYRIATNLAVNHARDTRHERAAQTIYLDAPDEETGSTPDVADDEPSVEQHMVRNERMAAIRAQVMALPERQRMAVLMHKYQGMDYRQIGDVLKLSESATKSLLFRAYQTLRERLKDFV